VETSGRGLIEAPFQQLDSWNRGNNETFLPAYCSVETIFLENESIALPLCLPIGWGEIN
jgi:hypothetical protein